MVIQASYALCLYGFISLEFKGLALAQELVDDFRVIVGTHDHLPLPVDCGRGQPSHDLEGVDEVDVRVSLGRAAPPALSLSSPENELPSEHDQEGLGDVQALHVTQEVLETASASNGVRLEALVGTGGVLVLVQVSVDVPRHFHEECPHVVPLPEVRQLAQLFHELGALLVIRRRGLPRVRLRVRGSRADEAPKEELLYAPLPPLPRLEGAKRGRPHRGGGHGRPEQPLWSPSEVLPTRRMLRSMPSSPPE